MNSRRQRHWLSPKEWVKWAVYTIRGNVAKLARVTHFSSRPDIQARNGETKEITLEKKWRLYWLPGVN